MRNPFGRVDWYVMLALLCVSVLLRVPRLDYPSQTVFDESVYARFASYDANRISYFEIHPPLARMFFSAAISHPTPVRDSHEAGIDFGSFPYVPVRAVSVLFGSFVPVVLFALVRLIGVRVRYAALAAALAAIDPMLIIFSRAILPDSVLWLFGLLGVAVAVYGARYAVGRAVVVPALLSGICIGAAMSVKWSGVVFAFAALAALVAFTSRWTRTLSVVTVLAMVAATVTHVGVWGVYVARFDAGPVDVSKSAYRSLEGDFSYPGTAHPAVVVPFVVEHAKTATAVQRNHDLMSKVLLNGEPIRWPIGMDLFCAWNPSFRARYTEVGAAMVAALQAGKINVVGLLPAYVLSAVSVLYLVGVSVAAIRNRKRLPSVGQVEPGHAFVLVSYALAFGTVAAMAMVRAMFNYHYVPAYFFALAALACALAHLSSVSPRSARLAWWAVIIVSAVFFLVQSVNTYGFPLL